MQKTDFVAWVASLSNFGFMYVNLTHLLEAAQIVNVVTSSIGSLLSGFLIAVKISEYFNKKKLLNLEPF